MQMPLNLRLPSADERTLALIAGVACLAGPRKTRPLSGFLYGAFLMRAAGVRARAYEDTTLNLFSQRVHLIDRIEVMEKALVVAKRSPRVHLFDNREAWQSCSPSLLLESDLIGVADEAGNVRVVKDRHGSERYMTREAWDVLVRYSS